MSKKQTTITIPSEYGRKLWNLRKIRKIVPKKKPGRGRPYSDFETVAEVFVRIIDEWEAVNNE